MSSVTQWWVLLQHQEELESILDTADLYKLSQDLLKKKVLPEDCGHKFASLDPDPDHLEQEVKVRYLLQHVFERVREDGKVYNRLVKVLSRLGGRVRDECGAMNREVAKESTTCGGDRNDEIALKDVPHLVQCHVSRSHLWEAIGIALEIPKHKLVDCGEGKASVSRD